MLSLAFVDIVLSAFLLAAFLYVFETLQIERGNADQLMPRSFASGKPQTTGDLVKAAKNLETDIKVTAVRELVRAAREEVEKWLSSIQ